MSKGSQELDHKLAVLIDAENAQAQHIGAVLARVGTLGIAQLKRAYGDWTAPPLSSWRCPLAEHAIHPVQQFPHTTGKNATDIAMVIDAMDLLHSGVFDGFCLVSSDSDYTRLVTRIKEAGLMVYGFGKSAATNTAYAKSFDQFFDTQPSKLQAVHTQDRPSPQKPAKAAPTNPQVTASHAAPTQQQNAGSAKVDGKVREAIGQATAKAAGRDGWANLSDVGNLLHKKIPSFKATDHGYTKLHQLIEATGQYDIKGVATPSGTQRMQIRKKATNRRPAKQPSRRPELKVPDSANTPVPQVGNTVAIPHQGTHTNRPTTEPPRADRATPTTHAVSTTLSDHASRIFKRITSR